MFLLIENVVLVVVILIFVPLSKIGRAQDWVKAKVKKVKDKIEED